MILFAPLAINWFSGLLLSWLDGRKTWVDWIANIALATSLGFTIRIAVIVFSSGPFEVVAGGWRPGVGISLRADALGVIFALVSNFLLLITLVYEGLEQDEERAFPALVLFLSTGLTGLFFTADAFNFYVFFEVSMASSFILSSYGQKPQEIRDTVTFTVANMIGSVFFLIAVAALYHLTGTLSMRGIQSWVIDAEPTSIILISTLIFAAFSIKLGLFPFHFWLPPVYRGLRPVIAAILSGVLANIGGYGLLRFGREIFWRELEYAGTVMIIIGVSSILYGSIQAARQGKIRDTLAYSSISQAGYFLVALAIPGPFGFAAAILYMILNAMNKTLLFLTTGLRGRLVGTAFVIGAFSVAGIPPAAGFFGKAALFQATISAKSHLLTGVIFVGSALSFIYMFQAYQKQYWQLDTSDQAGTSSLKARILVLALAVSILLLGLWPEPILAASRIAAQAFVGRTP